MSLAWQPGPYIAVAMDEPNSLLKGALTQVELRTQNQGAAKLIWPERSARYLAFLSGPADKE